MAFKNVSGGRRGTWVQRHEYALVEVAKEHIYLNANLVQALHLMRNRCIINEEDYRRLAQKFSSSGENTPREMFIKFLGELRNRATFNEFTCFLFEMDCSPFAYALCNQVSQPLIHLSGSDELDSTTVLQQFSNIKSHIDDNVYRGSKSMSVQWYAQNNLAKGNRAEDDAQRQFYVNLYASLSLLHLHLYTDDQLLLQEVSVDEVSKAVPQNTNITSALLTEMCMHAKIWAIRGDYVRTLECVDEMKKMLERFDHAFMRALIHFYCIIIYRKLYPSSCEYLVKLAAESADHSLGALSRHSKINTILFERIVYTHLVEVYLGIGLDCYVTSGRLKKEHKLPAKVIIERLESQIKPAMESRVKMRLSVCRAKICEDENEPKLACEHIKNAIQKAEDGSQSTLERDNINNYYQHLIVKLARGMGPIPDDEAVDEEEIDYDNAAINDINAGIVELLYIFSCFWLIGVVIFFHFICIFESIFLM
ncbi:uncharacterized protein LOC128209251 [Mya arenaria]|uniref:uncharacterized protein LOC128207997 n=1 Tax=Mya arenaria TaxID=6604 RepID=UPI0022E4DBA7|nr:uncharacterized protein LOC128207997 [Mya arenaria]XP_052767203.1 uncharacterized protein LOC128207997 [Mya arenaria]XP_052769163.1 uncharacterized protein LOC128209251 [Mya arenaria]XP_052769165.1 uncharacterized protein LOC128209251 [Mya arenaria]